MSCGSLPPVPGLIPISALRKSPSCNNNDLRECTPCAAQKEVMGEQRSRRTGSQPPVDLIDIARRSRGFSATPQAPSGKARAERHRKSDRRRERRGGRKRSTSKRRETSPEEKCVNPRVNPIFVWVRQEDNHIVDVKCEDYDKRNRIVLTKTAQGWRAIPRTETLVPNLKAAVTEEEDAAKHHSRKARKSNKVKRKSTAVQVDDDCLIVEEQRTDSDPPNTWNVPVNVESHLPSHGIPIHRQRSPSPEQIATTSDDTSANVNTSANHDYSAQASAVECSASKVCDVSPLDNLLAVAELEFNQQIQTEAWCEATNIKSCDDDDDDALTKDFDVSIEIITKTDDDAIIQQTAALTDLSSIAQSDNFDSELEKDDDCDYNEDDDNNLAMDDILTRLEQSLQSPDILCTELAESMIMEPGDQKQDVVIEVPDDTLMSYETNDYSEKEDVKLKSDSKEEPDVGSSVTEVSDDKPTDLSTSKKAECLTINLPDDDLMPTDLTLPKMKPRSPSPRPVSPRPSSRSSETIQSPQPSGLPAVPHSPDVQTTNKTAYLESLLSSTSQKISLNSEVTITRQKEPIDFGKCRKSASPTVTCSEEVNACSSSTNNKDGEPEAKKVRLDDVTLRAILDANLAQPAAKEETRIQPRNPKNSAPETSRLLELLTSESEPDALVQMKQLYTDPSINLPDPMLVPKDRLSQILMSPGKEIPKLLTQRPELRLPEALAFPHLLQDPDILVITLSQLETIIRKQTTLALPSTEKLKITSSNVSGKKAESEGSSKNSSEKEKATPNSCQNANSKHSREHTKQGSSATKEVSRMNELCNDLSLANNNALNQMMWLPYLHQLEVAAMAFGNGADFLKMLSSAFPPYSNQISDVSQMFPVNRFQQPTGFPMQPLTNNFNNNPFEFPIWHEATGHANLQQRPANQYERHCNNNKNAYREYMEKMSMAAAAAAATTTNGSKNHQSSSSHKYSSNNKTPSFPPAVYHQQNNPSLHNMQHPFMNVPATYQPPNMRPNLQIPQFNSILTQKNPFYNKNSDKTSPTTTNCDSKMANLYRERYETARAASSSNQRHNLYNQKLGTLANNHKSKASFNPLESLHKTLTQENFKKNSVDFVTQPMDLSGSNAGKSRHGKQNFCDSVNLAKSLKFDDIPEVGSTTASIEDMTAHMQESQKHLWHPLFGNQKSSSNPWNWSTVTATGE